MILRITDKLGKKIKEKPGSVLPLHPNPLADWSLALFTVGRIRYVMASHTVSLFSFIFHAKGITDPNGLIEKFMVQMREFFLDNRLKDVFLEKILPEAREFVFSKNISRSVIGCMNELIQMAKFNLGNNGFSAGIASIKVNDTLVRLDKKNYQTPLEAFETENKKRNFKIVN